MPDMAELSIESYKLFLIIPIIIMLILRTGGVSFFFRIFMKMFKVSYDSHQLKRIESKAYDLQLFKALEGINVRNIDDARFIKDKVNKGQIHQAGFLFTYPIGPIGDKKRTGIFFFGNAFIIVLCLSLALCFNHMSSYYKVGYYRVNAMGQSEYVSLSSVTTKNEDRFLGKSTCDFVLSQNFDYSIRTASCSIFIRGQGDDKLWLTKEIEKSDREYRIFYWVSVFYSFLFSYLSIGLVNFYRTNKLILKLKEEHEQAQG